MDSKLADFIALHSERIVAEAVTFARTVDVGTPLDEEQLRDHIPQIVEAVVADLRTAQTASEAFEKSEGRARRLVGSDRSAAGTHALHRAHSGYSVSQLVSEYRALRAAVLRAWAQTGDAELAASRDEVTRFNEAIDEAIAESVSHYADEVERWRNIFLGVLGHDLRSPLSAILMTSEMLGAMEVDAPIAMAAQRLIRSGKRMRDLLDSLLVYNRAQLGVGFVLEREDVDLAQAVHEEVDLLQASMPNAQITLDAQGPLRGSFDAARVREALSNLVVNASKYGVPGNAIHVRLRDADDVAELTVSNTGVPIAREKFDLMFEPLRRFSMAEGDEERVSLGLGLFVVGQIAKAHDGTIQADSADGITTFRLHLPHG